MKAAPHFGHLPDLPAFESSTENVDEQPGHAKRIICPSGLQFTISVEIQFRGLVEVGQERMTAAGQLLPAAIRMIPTKNERDFRRVTWHFAL